MTAAAASAKRRSSITTSGFEHAPRSGIASDLNHHVRTLGRIEPAVRSRRAWRVDQSSATRGGAPRDWRDVGLLLRPRESERVTAKPSRQRSKAKAAACYRAALLPSTRCRAAGLGSIACKTAPCRSSRHPTDLPVRSRRGGHKSQRACNGRGGLMLRMHVGDDPSGALPPKPRHHDLGGLPGISTTLMSGGDDPRDLGCDAPSVLSHRGLHSPNRACVVEAAHALDRTPVVGPPRVRAGG